MAITGTDVEAVQRLYAAVAAGDIAVAASCLAADAVWHIPGRSVLAGDHRGWPAIRDNFLAKLGPLSGRTLRIELLDITVGHDFIVAVQHVTAACQGRHLDVTGCNLMRADQGHIADVQGHYSDQYALDAFFSGPDSSPGLASPVRTA